MTKRNSSAAPAATARKTITEAKSSPARILLVEDDPGDAVLMDLALTRANSDFEVHHVTRLVAAKSSAPFSPTFEALVDAPVPLIENFSLTPLLPYSHA